MGRIMAWTPSLTGGIVVVRDPCLHGRFSIGSLCVGPSDTMSWSPTIGLLITPQEPIQPRLGGRVQRLLNYLSPASSSYAMVGLHSSREAGCLALARDSYNGLLFIVYAICL